MPTSERFAEECGDRTLPRDAHPYAQAQRDTWLKHAAEWNVSYAYVVGDRPPHVRPSFSSADISVCGCFGAESVFAFAQSAPSSHG
jgi:hypothetical protein